MAWSPAHASGSDAGFGTANAQTANNWVAPFNVGSTIGLHPVGHQVAQRHPWQGAGRPDKPTAPKLPQSTAIHTGVAKKGRKSNFQPVAPKPVSTGIAAFEQCATAVGDWVHLLPESLANQVHYVVGRALPVPLISLQELIFRG
jgi:hypothetical protein